MLMHKERWIIFSIITSSILPLLDGSVINIILPNLTQVFYFEDNIQWVVSSYFLFTAVGILISSFLQSKFGIKKTWILANAIFMLSSLFVGISTTFSQLIISRIMQGLGAGILLPLIQTVIIAEFGKENVNRIIGAVAIPAVFVPAIAPLIGALFIEYLSWRYLFLINIPFCLFSIFSAFSFFSSQEKESRQFNVVIFLSLSFSLCLFFFFADRLIHQFNLNNLFLSFISFILTIIMLNLNNKAENKIINFSGFKNKLYFSSILFGGLVSFLFFSFMIFFPLVVGDMNLFLVGLLLGIQGVGSAISRKYLSILLEKKSPFLSILIGVLISVFSLFFFYFSPVYQAIGFFIRGIGLGIATIICLSAPFNWAEQSLIKDTSVIIRIVQQIGATFGSIFSGFLIYLVTTNAISHYFAYSIYIVLSIFIFFYAFFVYLKTEKQQVSIEVGKS